MAQITEVRVRLLEGAGKVKAVASVTLDGEFVVHGVRVVEGPNGEFVAMPATRTGGAGPEEGPLEEGRVTPGFLLAPAGYCQG